MMDKNYVKKFSCIAAHEGMEIKDPYAFIDDVEAEIADLLESAFEYEDQAFEILENDQKAFELPFSIKRMFPNDDYLIFHGVIKKEWKKIGKKNLPYFSNSFAKIVFAKNGVLTERKFIYND